MKHNITFHMIILYIHDSILRSVVYNLAKHRLWRFRSELGQ
jgi:hypothetical protein